MSYGSKSGLDWQRQCGKWVSDTFGPASLSSLPNRAARVCEEGVELAQSEGVTKETALAIVERAYSRPVGEPRQEAAGVIFTVFAYAEAKDFSLLRALADELRRVKAKDPELFRDKQREKFAAGTDLVAPV